MENNQIILKFSEVKEIKNFCDEYSIEDWREVVNKIVEGDKDFEIDEVRFICDSVIRDVFIDQLKSDESVLGYVAGWAVEEVTNWPAELIQKVQETNSEIVGKAIVKHDFVGGIADVIISNDGYGHAFNYHDSSEEELFFRNIYYHVFVMR